VTPPRVTVSCGAPERELRQKALSLTSAIPGFWSGDARDRERHSEFLFLRHGTIATFDVPGGIGSTAASAINPENRITGIFSDAAGVTHGFLFIPQGSGMSAMTC